MELLSHFHNPGLSGDLKNQIYIFNFATSNILKPRNEDNIKQV